MDISYEDCCFFDCDEFLCVFSVEILLFEDEIDWYGFLIEF